MRSELRGDMQAVKAAEDATVVASLPAEGGLEAVNTILDLDAQSTETRIVCTTLPA